MLATMLATMLARVMVRVMVMAMAENAPSGAVFGDPGVEMQKRVRRMGPMLTLLDGRLTGDKGEKSREQDDEGQSPSRDDEASLAPEGVRCLSGFVSARGREGKREEVGEKCKTARRS